MRENTVKSVGNGGASARNGWMAVFAKGMAQAGMASLTGELPYGPLD